MQRLHLEHILRAAGAITGYKRIVVVGSQAILGSCPSAPKELLVSIEADIYPLDEPGRADLIDGTIGELSPFHEQFGYYAHGVGPETAVLPGGWLPRAARISNDNTGGVEGICPCPADLAASKLCAGRPKDADFVSMMLTNRIVTPGEIRAVLGELTQPLSELAEHRLGRITAGLSSDADEQRGARTS